MPYYARDDTPCPKCGGQTDQIDVDIGVGTIYGPRGCIDCGWSEDDQYDQHLQANRKPDERGGYKDQFGYYHPPGSSVANAYALADQAANKESTPWNKR